MMAMPSFLHRVRFMLVLALVVIWYLLLASPVQAQNIQRHAETGRVTIIVLDMSGSMATNDPEGVRCSAANAYIDLSKPDDFIGVVGLDSVPGQAGPYNFGSAFTWASPTQMQTRDDQQNLKNIITSKSNHCAPDASTPTYDALDRARKMLESATQGGRTGSVILLTDGKPEPDGTRQIQEINRNLIPEFRDRGWPIDTVALGTKTDFTFLQAISNATKGLPYSDVQNGVASPLNIAPLFVKLFAVRSGLTVGPNIGTTQLDGGTTSRDFVIGDYIDSLAVVAIKDDPDATVTLTSPGPNRVVLSNNTPGTFIANGDPHYAFFSVDKPQKGTWTLSVTGNQSFLMDSLISSSLKIQLITPASQTVLPLGQPFLIQANVTSQGIPTGDQFSLESTITYQGTTIGQTPMRWDNTSATYKLYPTIPVSDKRGTYDITVSASSISGTAISEVHSIVQLDNFPLPQFFVPGTHVLAPVKETVSANSVVWDPFLRWLYDHPLSFSKRLASWALQNVPTEPQAVLDGQVELQGQPFPDATTSAVVIPAGSKIPIPVTLNNAHGNFSVQFPALVQGIYTVRFSTSGSYRGSNDFGITTYTVKLTTGNVPLVQEVRAWFFTAVLYPFCLVLVALILLFFIKPAPVGRYTLEKLLSDGHYSQEDHAFKVKRGTLRALLYRNRLSSNTALSGAKKGLELQVNYDRKRSVRVRVRRGYDKLWLKGKGEKISTTQFQKTDEVTYSKDSDRQRYIFQKAEKAAKVSNRSHTLSSSRQNKSQKGNKKRQANTRQTPKRRI